MYVIWNTNCIKSIELHYLWNGERTMIANLIAKTWLYIIIKINVVYSHINDWKAFHVDVKHFTNGTFAAIESQTLGVSECHWSGELLLARWQGRAGKFKLNIAAKQPVRGASVNESIALHSAKIMLSHYTWHLNRSLFINKFLRHQNYLHNLL